MNKTLLFISLILLISLASATSIGTFQQKEGVQLYQTCNNCNYCNITTLRYQNITLLSNIEMTKDETYYYYELDKENVSNLGEYSYCYDCGNDVEKETGCLGFGVTGTGFELNLSRTNLSIALLGLMIFSFIVCIFGASKLPSTDNYDEDEKLISVSKLKYLRPVLFGVSWFLLLGTFYAGGSIALAYMGTTLLGDVLFTLFRIMLGLTPIMILVWFLYIFVSIFQDKKTKRLIERGFE